MTVNFKALHDYVLVDVIFEDEQGESSIIIPDSAKSRIPKQGIVISAGEGNKSQKDGKRIPLDVRRGDKVLIDFYRGIPVTLKGGDYLVFPEKEILAILPH